MARHSLNLTGSPLHCVDTLIEIEEVEEVNGGERYFPATCWGWLRTSAIGGKSAV
jgi:hypothetical protein